MAEIVLGTTASVAVATRRRRWPPGDESPPGGAGPAPAV